MWSTTRSPKTRERTCNHVSSRVLHIIIFHVNYWLVQLAPLSRTSPPHLFIQLEELLWINIPLVSGLMFHLCLSPRRFINKLTSQLDISNDVDTRNELRCQLLTSFNIICRNIMFATRTTLDLVLRDGLKLHVDVNFLPWRIITQEVTINPWNN